MAFRFSELVLAAIAAFDLVVIYVVDEGPSDVDNDNELDGSECSRGKRDMAVELARALCLSLTTNPAAHSRTTCPQRAPFLSREPA